MYVRSRKLCAVLLGGIVAWLSPSSARAYTFHEAPEGLPARWSTNAIEVVVDSSIDAIDPNAMNAIHEAFAAWEGSGAALPAVSLVMGKADPVGFRAGVENHSTVRYAADGDPMAEGALAITMMTFDDLGNMVDADVILNGGESRRFALLDGELPFATTLYDYDLQNVATHEIGHFFGLGEELVDRDATMFISSARGETKKRTLDDDDRLGIQTLYAGAAPQSTSSIGGCSTSPGGAEGGFAIAIAIAIAVSGLALRRRRSR